jgi:hypothetical protein
MAILVVVLSAVGLYRTITAQPPPQQPIAFSHRIHAGDRKIDCQYCHAYARRSIDAGIPAVSRCMGCHQYVGTGKPEVQKLTVNYWVRKQPVPWVNVYRVPGFVYFPHKRHIAAGLRCQRCHGPVETMEQVYFYQSREFPNSTLEMGWCLECHKERGAPRDCYTCHK